MAQLNAFVANHIPLSLRHGRDFTGSRGWVHICNRVMKRLEAEGLLPRDRVWEIPVWIDNTYWPNEIRPPADFKRALDIYEYDDPDRHYEWEVVGGRLKLTEDYDDTAAYDTATTRQATGTPTTRTCVIPETGGTSDSAKGYAFMNLGSAGVENFDTELRVITRSVYSTNFTELYWDKALPTAPSTGNYIFLIQDYLMLRYEATYGLLTTEASEIPLSTDLETVIASGMIALASMPGSKERRQAEKDFEDDIDSAGKAHFTPSVEQARPKGRPWPDFTTDDTNTHTWSGS